MTNLFWYILISALGLAVSAFSIYAGRKTWKLSTLITFYFFAAGLSWMGEFSVLGLFNSYAYFTGVFNDQWAQNLFGHLLLNSTLYPAVAMVMAAFSLRYGWALFVAALFTSLEFFFVKMGLYEQHWWRYFMTIITSIVYILATRWSFIKITRNPTKIMRAFIMFFAALVIVHMPAPVLLLLDLQHYELGILRNFYGDFYLSSIIFIFSYHLIECFLLVVFTCILEKWYWKIAPFILSVAAQGLFVKLNILHVDNGWKLNYTLLTYAAFIALFELLEHFAFRVDQEKLKKAQLGTFH